MRNVSRETSDVWGQLPSPWHESVRSQLLPGEQLLAWLDPDLNEELHYARSLIVLTDRRWLATTPQVISDLKHLPAITHNHWETWDLDAIASVHTSLVNGLGALELIGSEKRLAIWRFTAAKAIAANKLVQQYHAAQRAAHG